MGIYDFYSKFVRGMARSVTGQSIPRTGVEGISVDLNGLLHVVAQRVFLYGSALAKEYNNEKWSLPLEEFATLYATRLTLSPEEVHTIFFNELQIEIEGLIKNFEPNKYMIIAVDGIVPAAKIQQQRLRRYKAVPLNIEEQYSEFRRLVETSTRQAGGNTDTFIKLISNGIVENHPTGMKIPALAGFFNGMISPGTTFMKNINSILEAWISERTSYLPPLFVYSSHEVAGEGEHKIFSMLRDYHLSGDIKQGNGTHIIYGKDSDLTLLSFICPLLNAAARTSLLP